MTFMTASGWAQRVWVRSFKLEIDQGSSKCKVHQLNCLALYEESSPGNSILGVKSRPIH